MTNVKIDYYLNGSKSSVTIDSFIFGVFCIQIGSESKARQHIRDSIQNCFPEYPPENITMSKWVLHNIFTLCCKPSLIDKYENYEGQFDFEDF